MVFLLINLFIAYLYYNLYYNEFEITNNENNFYKKRPNIYRFVFSRALYKANSIIVLLFCIITFLLTFLLFYLISSKYWIIKTILCFFVYLCYYLLYVYNHICCDNIHTILVAIMLAIGGVLSYIQFYELHKTKTPLIKIDKTIQNIYYIIFIIQILNPILLFTTAYFDKGTFVKYEKSDINWKDVILRFIFTVFESIPLILFSLTYLLILFKTINK